MPATKVVMVRHGQTDYNVQARYQGQNDIMLNQTGQLQVGAMAQVLSRRLSSPSKSVGVHSMTIGATKVELYCSPLLRAHQTAEALGKALARVGFEDPDPGDDMIAPVIDPAFIERGYGVFEGHTRAECAELWPDAFAEMQETGESAMAGVENSHDVGYRVEKALLRRTGEAPDGSTVIVVSHGTAINRGVLHLIGLDPQTFEGLRGMDNAHWCELVRDSVDAPWRIASYNIGADESQVGA